MEDPPLLLCSRTIFRCLRLSEGNLCVRKLSSSSDRSLLPTSGGQIKGNKTRICPLSSPRSKDPARPEFKPHTDCPFGQVVYLNRR